MRGQRFHAVIGGGETSQPEPKWAALRRAVRAVFDAHDRHHARWYTYVEHAGESRVDPWPSDMIARGAYGDAQDKTTGELYAALFDAGDPSWPDPISHVYRSPGAVVGADSPGPVTTPSQAASELLAPFSGSGRYRVVVRLADSVVPVWASDDLELVRARAREVWLRTGTPSVIYDSKTGRNVGSEADSRAPVNPYGSAPAPTPTPAPRSPAAPTAAPDLPPGRIAPSPRLYELALNELTDGQFWTETNYKPHQALNPKDPQDAAMIPRWMAIRASLARTKAPDEILRSLATWKAWDLNRRQPAPFFVYASDPSGGALFPQRDLESAYQFVMRRLADSSYVAWFKIAELGRPELVNEFWPGAEIEIDKPPTSPANVSGWYPRGNNMSDGTNPTGIISGHRGYAAPARGYRHGGGGYGYWRAPFRDRLAYIAPIAYPAAGGAGVQFRLEGDMLVASICVDGRCYEGRYDLGELLARRGVSVVEQPMDPQMANDAAQEVAAAGDTIVGALLDDHVDAVIGGWWDDVTKTVGDAVHGAEKALTGTVSATLGKLKDPIAAAAKMAIPALASAIPGGALVAPLAQNLVTDMVNAATGTPAQKQQAKAQVAAVQQRAAQGDPTAKKALKVAKRAVAKSTTTYHAAQTATNAASGNPDAQAQIAELQGAAQSGDAAAGNLLAAIQKLTAALASSSVAPGGAPATPAAAQWQTDPAMMDPNAAAQDPSVSPMDQTATVASVSGVASTGRQAASAAAQAEYKRSGAPAIGVVFQSNGAHVAIPMPTLDDADDWLAKLESGTFTYAAYFDPGDPTWPAPINERVGAKVISSGWLAPVLAAFGGFGLGAAGWPYLAGKFAGWSHGPAPVVPASPTTAPK